MRNIVFTAVALALIASVPASGQSVSKDPALAPAGTYAANQNHTQVLFSVRHLGLTDFHGRFDKVSGTLTFDNRRPERSAVSITIDTTSLDTTSEKLNNDLKTIFRVQEFPAMTFKSTAVTRTGPDTGRIDGMLTIKDVTRPVILDVTFNGGGKSMMSGGDYSLGFHATGVLRRSDFGLDKMFWSGFVSDEVALTIEAEFDQKS
ncbi:MAG TPA: YceI family protein [Rhizomicrobium sp.]|nr:YceI family protein [Rhizomicrobium sp.]